ncbi:MAG: AMP-binding protein [Gemmatimonadetes bacterium]|nr:AMP-binding protein [Gemmatimonadota bacterium]
MLNFMLQVPGQAEADTSSVRWFMSGAAPVPVSLIETYAKLGIEIHQVYGLTETCGPACLISPEEAIAKAGAIARLLETKQPNMTDIPSERARHTIRNASRTPPHLVNFILNSNNLINAFHTLPK